MGKEFDYRLEILHRTADRESITVIDRWAGKVCKRGWKFLGWQSNTHNSGISNTLCFERKRKPE